MNRTINRFDATADEMGNWGGQEQDAAECWNEYVAPALLVLHTRIEDEDGDAHNIVGNVQQLAWDAFCDTPDDESWDELGRRVAAIVNQ